MAQRSVTDNTRSELSGLIDYVPENIDQAPESPGVFQVVSPGQKVMYVGAAGDHGLREALWELYEEQAINASEYFRYRVTADADEAKAVAARMIEKHKPPYNVGYSRFRNDQVSLPKQGHRVRSAAPNP